jgi:hypothetical protein
MLRRTALTLLGVLVLSLGVSAKSSSADENAYGRVWGGNYKLRDWERYYHYPYVYYPQNYWGSEYFRSNDSMYYRYPPEMRIPVYNKQWHNYYPQGRHFDGNAVPNGSRYHQGHQFILDVF